MGWFSKSKDPDLDDEIRFHLEMEARKNRENGMSPSEAEAAARKSFGGVEKVKEELRDLRPLRMLSDVRRDLLFAAKTLRKAAGYSLTTIVTIGVAVGVSAAILTFVVSVANRPLPYGDIDRAVTLWESNLATGEDALRISPANFLDWQERSTVFKRLGLLSPYGFDFHDGTRTVSVNAAKVSVDWFPALGVRPEAGALFDQSDHEASPEFRVLISHRFWSDYLGSDPSIVGRTIEVDRTPARVIGVLPRDLDYPNQYDIYAPLNLYPGEATSRTGHWMWASARLKPGVTLEEAKRDLDRVALTIARENPQTNESLRVRMVPLEESIKGTTNRLLSLLTIASVALLLAACSNVGALCLARGAGRRRELAIRAALGATTSRLVRQLSTESALLIAAASALALALAWGIIRAIAAATPGEVSLLADVSPGAVTVLLLAALALFSLLLSGVLPAYRLVGANLARDLEISRRDSGQSRGEARIQSTLIVVQIAVAILLLIGAALLVRSLDRLTGNPLGFDPNNVATLELFLYDLHPDSAERTRFVDETLRDIESMPGVEAAAATTALPFAPAMDARDEFEIIGRPRRSGESLSAGTTAVTPNLFDTLGIPLIEGRWFDEHDRPGVERVAIVSLTGAQRFWPGQSPLGEKVLIGLMGPPHEWTVVGVAGDVRHGSYDEEPQPHFYMPLAQTGIGGMTWVFRVSGDSQRMLPEIERRVLEISPTQSITSVATMESLVSETLRIRRFALVLMGGFALAAFLVCTIGLYGLIRYICVRRTTEVGIRMAIGATPHDILRLFVGRGMALALVGIAIGVLVSLPIERFISPYLYETSVRDTGTLAMVIALMAATALAASWLPARRMSALDPNTVLRTD